MNIISSMGKEQIGLLMLLVVTILFVGGCKKDVQPEACFTTSSSQYTIYDTIRFNNCTSEGSTYKWEFGDGASSTQIDPIHSYNQPDEYRVSLKASSQNDQFQDYTYKVLEILEPVVGLWRVDYVEKRCFLANDSSLTNTTGNGNSDYLKVEREGNFKLHINNMNDQGEWTYNVTSVDLADTTYKINTINEEEMVLVRDFPSDSVCVNGRQKWYFLKRQKN